MKKYKFKAKMEAGDGGGAYVLFPYDTGTEFAPKEVPVKATFDVVPYTGRFSSTVSPFICWVCLKHTRANWEKPGRYS